MKKFLHLIPGLIFIFFLGSCANIIPPGGGAIDSLPPVLISANPADSSTQFTAKKIVFTFNEFVDLNNIQQNLVVSPIPKQYPVVERKLKTVTVKILDSLSPNTTYTLDFANGIKDINEGNLLRGFKYVFTTGTQFSKGRLSGTLITAKTGEPDSTLIAVLFKELADSAVHTKSPLYMAKVDGKGNFLFENIEKGNYRLYAVPNDYTKRYDDSTKWFAFFSDTIRVTENETAYSLYAFQQAEKKQTPSSTKPTATAKKPKPYTTNASNGRLGLTDTLWVRYDSSLIADVNKLQLTDTLFNTINTTTLSDSGITYLLFNKAENFHYKLLIAADVFNDTAHLLPKSDTLNFTTNRESDYGSLRIFFKNIETANNPVLLLIQNNEIKKSIPVNSTSWYQRLFVPGEYRVKVLYDTNNNGVWDNGYFPAGLQPEVVRDLKLTITIRANWDNETELNF